MSTQDTNMLQEMREAGSSLPDMVEALQFAGWKTKGHHDNWVHENFPNGLDTHEAWKKLSFVDQIKPAQLRMNITIANMPRDANNVLNWPRFYAEHYLKYEEIQYRISSVDGEPRIVTRDYKPERANLVIKNGIVTEINFG